MGPWMSDGLGKQVSEQVKQLSSRSGVLARIILRHGHKSKFMEKTARKHKSWLCFSLLLYPDSKQVLYALLCVSWGGTSCPTLPLSHAHLAGLYSKHRAMVKEIEVNFNPITHSFLEVLKFTNTGEGVARRHFHN